MTPARFSQIGELLYGPSWRGALADKLKVAERTLYRWIQPGGVSTIPELSGELAELCRAHAAELTKAADQLERRRA